MIPRLLLLIGMIFASASPASAWTGPTQAAPNGNVAAPVNVGATAQVKSGTIGVNGLAVFGNSLLQASSYLNWGATAGLSGYGIRDNAGTLEFKNSGGTGGTSGWKSLQTIINEYIALAGSGVGGSGTINYVPKFTAGTTLGNSQIFDNGTNVGVGTAAAVAKLQVNAPVTTNVSLTWNAAAGQILRNENSELAIGLEDTSPYPIYLQARTNTSAVRQISLNPLGGNVGIGTVSPAQILDVNGQIAVGGVGVITSGGNDVYANVRVIRNTSATLQDGMYINYGSTGASNQVRFFTPGTTQRMAILPSGRVGINSTGPGSTLQVTALDSAEAIYGYNNSGGIGTRGWSNTSVGGYFQSAGANYGAYGESAGNYGVYGKTLSASYGGVLGYAQNGSTFGILGHANAYSLYGNASSYVSGTSYASGFIYLSDERLKKNVRPIENSLWKLSQLDGVTFDWNEEKGGHKEGQHDVGVIAQDVEKVLPEAVTVDIDSGYKAVDYPRLVPLLIGAIKEQQEEIEALEKRLEALEKRE